MSPEDIRKLLGGYATGTLTTEEQQALFAAALEDQELFDELAREQSLRDLLRDPAARAELLGALDTPAKPGGFWQWLRRPMVAGLATAGVAAVAIVAVWQGTRVASVRRQTEPVMVAELKRPDAVTTPSAPQPPALANQPESSIGDTGAGAPAAVKADKKTAPAMALRSRQFEPGAVSQSAGSAGGLMKEKQAVIAMAPAPARQVEGGTLGGIAAGLAAPAADKKAMAGIAPPPPPPAAPAPMPVLMARKAEADAAPSVPRGGLVTGATVENLRLDARTLFYLDQLAPGANAFVESGGGGGSVPPPAAQATLPKDAPQQMAKGAPGLVAPLTATAPRLGVRVSILRAAGEVDLTTALDPGETVRLKLIPNADGYLYVAEGARTVSSGRTQRWQPFETPKLRFKGSGQKHLIVLLSRRPRILSPQLLLESLVGDNLVESSAGQERATYIVSGPREAGAQEVVVPVTLTYR